MPKPRKMKRSKKPAETSEEREPPGPDSWLSLVTEDEWLCEFETRWSAKAPSRRRFDAWTHSLARAILRNDAEVLSTAEERLGHAQAQWRNQMADTAEAGEVLGRLRALVCLAAFGLEVVTPVQVAALIEPESVGTRFLNALVDSGEMHSSAIAEAIRVDPTEVSRTGARLLTLGMVGRKRIGRRSRWTLMPSGREALLALAQASGSGPSPRRSHSQPALLVWGEAQERKVKRSPSRFSTNPLSTVDLVAELVDEAQTRSQLSSLLLMSASVRRFCESASMSFTIFQEHNRKESEERAWSALSEQFERDLDFESFWPSTAPSWDAQALIEGPNGRLGVILIDVPENPKQIASRVSWIKRDDHAAVATSALKEAVEAFNLSGGVIPQEHRYSDLLRRMVLVHYLRTHCEIPAWSAKVCFVSTGHSTRIHGIPDSQDKWEDALERAREDSQISQSSLSQWAQQHFVPVHD